MEISNDIAQVALPHAETRHAGSAERMSNTTRTDCPGEQVFAQALRDDSNQELDWL